MFNSLLAAPLLAWKVAPQAAPLLAQAALPDVTSVHIGLWIGCLAVFVVLVERAVALMQRFGLIPDRRDMRDASEIYATKQEMARVELDIRRLEQDIARLERETEEGRRRLYEEIRAVVAGMNETTASLRESVGRLSGIIEKSH